jgi:glycosyltransferase involved in cell wall biosynthesis/peptidoglycan/xylan/chitin deacetylase (PgdA/CDA1 family)
MTRPLVLCYHAVSEDWDSPLAVTAGQLEAQIRRLLRRGYRGATFHEAVTGRPPGKPLVVSFDGGFCSTWELARPVLERLGLPATVFVSTAYIDEAGLADWPGLDVWVGGPREKEIALMSWDQLRSLSESGWEIGAHGRSHHRLTLLDDDELAAELRACKADCEAALGRPCRSLSYPYGDVSLRVVEAAAAAGFEAAAGLPFSYGARARLNWPRTALQREDTGSRLAVKLAAARLSLRLAGLPRETDALPSVDRAQFANLRQAAPQPGDGAREPRVGVVIPCYNDGRFLTEALDSIREHEPIEAVVVDDASTDEGTIALLARLEAAGTRVLRHQRNRGLSESRMTGVRATSAPYLFPLDADDLLIPGALSALAGRLDAEPDLAVCYGDYAVFGTQERIVRTPDRLDPYRIAYRNEYPGPSLFRRAVLEQVGGWRDVEGRVGYEDWNLWMSLAEQGHRASHVGPGTVIMRYRQSGGRMLASANRGHRELYAGLRRLHPALFADLRAHRRVSTLGRGKAILYPVAFGTRRRRGIYSAIRRITARTGLAALSDARRSRRRGGPDASEL